MTESRIAGLGCFNFCKNLEQQKFKFSQKLFQPSFLSPSEEILKKIQSLDINSITEERNWSMISNQAKDLVRKTMCKDTSKRITAEQILKHPWIIQRDVLPEFHLPVKNIPTNHQQQFGQMNGMLRPTENKAKGGLASNILNLKIGNSNFLKARKDKKNKK